MGTGWGYENINSEVCEEGVPVTAKVTAPYYLSCLALQFKKHYSSSVAEIFFLNHILRLFNPFNPIFRNTDYYAPYLLEVYI